MLDDRELRSYVARAVARTSNDQQHPVVDTDNLDVKVELPIVPQAAGIVGRAEPNGGAKVAGRGLQISAEASVSVNAKGAGAGALDPCALATPPPHGCGCAVPGQAQRQDAALLGLGLLGASTLLRRRRLLRAGASGRASLRATR